MTTTESALRYMSGENKTLDIMFNFDHMMADCFMTEYIHRPFNLIKLKKAFSKWQKEINGKAWNTLYLENHDHPRVISRYGNEKFHRESGTMLAACFLFQQGTPFIYQGQEIGMTNIQLKSIDQYVDVSSKTNYHRFHTKEDTEKRLGRIYHSSRDSARTPMQWDATENAGFSKETPWFFVNENYKEINVESQEKDPYSILNFYRKCLFYRKNSEVILWGEYKEFFASDPLLYMYERNYRGKRVMVVCSFSDQKMELHIPKEYQGMHGKLVLCNYKEHDKKYLQPYETRVYEVH